MREVYTLHNTPICHIYTTSSGVYLNRTLVFTRVFMGAPASPLERMGFNGRPEINKDRHTAAETRNSQLYVQKPRQEENITTPAGCF